ncbi:type II toxin-antitoxin system HicB family antitoxin [Staphylospora marina]|uniref:type II toxin-antitoxin system HicB family antitoxin n=1 Tax=Staphylospora marina TaxID=2490858 RepID=UPI000F5BD51F|nr:type II toxin-antitoxin system HicB family antitoxin [Staphylospora marina]
MKNHYVYPVVFEQAENNVSFYFPDFPGTAGSDKNIVKGIDRARDLLGHEIARYERQGKELPTPSDPKDIELYDSTDRIVFIDVWVPPYRDAEANKAVKKTVTLPKWLNDAGDAAGLNFSQLLQTAVKQALGIQDHR